MTDKTPGPEPGSEEYAKCSILVAKAIILQSHKYTQDEIDLADFLEVVAGIAHPGLKVEEAHAALVYPLKQQ